ncbi:hypothetical protein LEP1GSC186_1756 [Leptospira noguchii serovar Autumnalis str. ZUN142]|uniref:Uncharacterized protein n=1 Tax=Leptospira noguchii serovar Autumnalis str. ZUN142 TaxID=1085540 RepID=M6UKW6_9LEPT|nr:hypothetical protein LEP1GSC186_1756 [Leptospira noguchii serovar Autumnalis str. ZUN142]
MKESICKVQISIFFRTKIPWTDSRLTNQSCKIEYSKFCMKQ